MSDSAADAAARELALDPARSILLEAPAGSGKTTVLTRRFLALLCIAEEPEQILAITFTRKAAGEMRERILRALRAEDGALERAALARSRARGWALDVNPGRLRIQTIDSLNRWLASQLPLAARGVGEASVMETPERLYRRAARRALLDAEADETLRRDADRLFERLDNDFGRFERLLTDMLRVRGHWLPVLLGESAADAPLDARGAELPARVEESLRALVADRLRQASSTIPAPLVAEGSRLGEEAARRRAAADTRAGPWRAWLDPPPSGEPLALAHWQGLAQLALTGEGEWRRSLTKREGFPAEEKQLKARALDWIAELSRADGARDRLVELASLPAPALAEDDAAALASLARLLQLAASELAVVFEEAGRVDFPQVAAAARQALTEEGSPSDLALRLGADIRHILVDEFQDTSIEQLKLLEALTAGWEEGDGRTLFAVGDPMQSIYQFREAEVGLFLRAGTHGIGRIRLEPVALTRNFRARPALVAWLNATFPRCFPPLDDPRASAVRYRPCAAGRADAATSGGASGGSQTDVAERGARTDVAGHGAQLHVVPSADPRAETREIVALIRRMRARDPAASIGVLVASRAHAAPIAAALEAAGIPVAGVDLVPLGALPVVRDLEALARALDHLADRTAWLAVLRAPWCGLTLAELSLLLEGVRARTVWEAIGDERRVALLGPGARARLERTRGVLEQALAQRDRLDLASWVEATWLRLGGPAACREDADLDRAQAFLARLTEWSSEPGWSGPLELAERLAALHAPREPSAADAVQIMTIHRAKGLEFDHVIVPALGRRLRASSEPLLRWLELPREAAGTDLLMAAIPPPWRRGDEPLSAYLKALAARRAANERVRLLYVAATRARSELHLFAEPPAAEAEGANAAPAEGTLLASLWPAIAGAFSDACASKSAAIDPAASDFATSDAGISGPAAADLRGAAAGPGTDARLGPARSSPLARLAADWCLPMLAAAVPAQAEVDVAGGPAAGDETADLALAGQDARRTAHAATLVVCDQLRRCARSGRLPPAGSASVVRALRERASRLGLDGGELEEASRRAAAMLDACLTDPQLQWLFSPIHAGAESPFRVSGLYEGRVTSVTVDRSFIDEKGARWLVLFDASDAARRGSGAEGRARPREAERQRMAKLLALAGALGSEPVRAAVYDPAARELREPR